MSLKKNYLDNEETMMINEHKKLTYHGGVKETNGYPYPLYLVIRFSVTITTTKVWNSNYSKYQEYFKTLDFKIKDLYIFDLCLISLFTRSATVE